VVSVIEGLKPKSDAANLGGFDQIAFRGKVPELRVKRGQPQQRRP